MRSLLYLFVTLVSICTSMRDDYTKDAKDDRIKSLPGLDKKTFEKYTMFSGYIDLQKDDKSKSIFYWFVESLNDPKKDPLVVWTNGGPGISGLTGMFLSLGPFRPLKNGSLMVNPYSWVNVANIIFIEQPAGVGFSITENPNFTNTDNSTALDNFRFIYRWTERFSNFRDNDLYLSSESYGGHYLPALAKRIVLINQAGKLNHKVNLKGIFVGNPYTDPVETQRGHYETLYGHQLISKPGYEHWKDVCHYGADNANRTQECTEAILDIFMNLAGPINGAALDYPICLESSRHNQVFVFYQWLAASGVLVPPQYQSMIRYFEDHPEEILYRNPGVQANRRGNGLPNIDDLPYEPCAENYLNVYLNREDVQKAIHAIPPGDKWPGRIKYAPDNLHANPIQPTWQWLLDNDPSLHLTIFSGDNDAAVGTWGTQMWMWEMGWEADVNTTWKLWMTEETQTGGWFTKFNKGVNLLTVHSGGHAVPQTQPSRALQAFKRYLDGEF